MNNIFRYQLYYGDYKNYKSDGESGSMECLTLLLTVYGTNKRDFNVAIKQYVLNNPESDFARRIQLQWDYYSSNDPDIGAYSDEIISIVNSEIEGDSSDGILFTKTKSSPVGLPFNKGYVTYPKGNNGSETYFYLDGTFAAMEYWHHGHIGVYQLIVNTGIYQTGYSYDYSYVALEEKSSSDREFMQSIKKFILNDGSKDITDCFKHHYDGSVDRYDSLGISLNFKKRYNSYEDAIIPIMEHMLTNYGIGRGIEHEFKKPICFKIIGFKFLNLTRTGPDPASPLPFVSPNHRLSLPFLP